MAFRDAREFSPVEAADPSIPLDLLAEMARQRPDLRPVIWGNPACPEGLRAWMQAARDAEAAGSPIPAFVAPVSPPPVLAAPPAPPADSSPGAPFPLPGSPNGAGSLNSPGSPNGPNGPGSPNAPGSPNGPNSPEKPGSLEKHGSPEKPGNPKRRRRALFAIGVVAALVLGAAGGGFIAGWTLSGEIEARKPATENKVIEVEVPSYSGLSQVPMPDIRGLDETAAREVLADAGIPPEVVEVTSREAAGPENVVVEQTPAFGTTNPTAVALVVSTKALVPAVDGLDASAIVASLAVLGADVEVIAAYVPGATAGSVLSIVPATGEPLPTHVTLTVAEASSSIYLASLDRVDGRCSATSTQIDGLTYDSSLKCSADGDGEESSWVVSRVVDSLEATVGIPDDGDPATRIRVEVLADGVVVATVEAGYGAPTTLVAPVVGALRLTVRSTLLGGSTSWATEDVVLGDARLVGGADAIKALDS